MAAPAVTSAMADSASYVCLGSDLTDEQRAEVLRLLGVSEDELDIDTLVTVTNEDEHRYLDGVLPDSVIGTRALSSCKVIQRENGHGIQVKTANISYLTEGMFQNALATAGMKDADVIVSGTVVQADLVEAATNELVTSGELAELLGDSGKTEQLIAAAKQIISEKDLSNEEEIRSTVTDLAGQLGYVLSEDEMSMVTGLMKQISSLDLDADALTQQALGIYEAAVNSGVDFSQFGIDSDTVDKAVEKAPGLIENLLGWFGSAFEG